MATIGIHNYGPTWGNIYVYGEKGGPCIVFDFGAPDGKKVLDSILKNHSQILGLFLTHGHFDHIGGLLDTKLSFPVFISSDDFPCLGDASLNFSKSLVDKALSIELESEPYFVEDGDEIKVGPYKVKCLSTPGHTLGSMCFLLEENILISGDTLFKNGIGRTDLRHNDKKSMSFSLRKLKDLPPQTIVYPGHGVSTTIENEIKFNPYLK